MIAFLQGILEYKTESEAVVSCGGVGYSVTMPAMDLAELITGNEVRVYTAMIVNENVGVALYGFSSDDRLQFFRLLITVSGIGPKAAIGILSGMTVQEMRMAIISDDVATISKAPGIGKKTAAKLVLELKDKVDWKETLLTPLTGESSKAVSEPMTGAKEEAVLALVALGYSKTDALRAVSQVEGSESMNSDDILSCSLRYL